MDYGFNAYTSPGVNEIIWVSESDPVTMIKDGDGGANNDWFQFEIYLKWSISDQMVSLAKNKWCNNV